MTEKKKNTPTRRIGFRIYNEEPEVEPMKTINTEEEETEETPQENSTVMLEDYIPGAVYDGAGNIVTYQSFMANVKKIKAEAKNLRRTSAAKFILYVSLAASILMLSYGAYKKYLNPAEKAKVAMIKEGRQR